MYVPYSLVLLALLSVIFDNCFRNWHGIGLLDCGSPWRCSWWVGVFRLSWNWSLVACEGCSGLLVILVYYFINIKIRKHLKKSCWDPGWGCVKIFILLFSYRYFCDSIFFALHTERSASWYDVELFLVVVIIGLFQCNQWYVKSQKLAKSPVAQKVSVHAVTMKIGLWLFVEVGGNYRWKGLDEGFIAL